MTSLSFGRHFEALLVLVSACASAPATPRSSGPAGGSARHAAEPAATAALEDRDWDVVDSPRFSLSFPLPERKKWTIDDASGTWLVARHANSGSELLVRTWRAGRLTTPRDCEMQARLWKPGLVAVDEQDETVERRQLGAPRGYHTEVIIGARRRGSEVEGYALAFGAAVGRCFAAAYTTHAEGQGTEQALGKRLALIVDRGLAELVVREVDDRARNQRAPPR